MTSAALVDRVVTEPVIVLGSLPPAGRDLDLLVTECCRQRIETALRQNRFTERNGLWVRFADCRVDVIELIPASSLRLPQVELARLLTESRQLPEFVHLSRPAPHHVALMLARRLVDGDGHLDAARRARLETALEEDPNAWAVAQTRVAYWGAGHSLPLLGAARRDGSRASRRRRAVAIFRRHRALGDDLAWSSLRAVRKVVAATPKGHVIAICGMDGAGKSSQADALARVLDQLGQPSVTRWTRVSANPSLATLAKPVVRVMVRLRGTGEHLPVPADLDASRLTAPSQRLRQGSPVLTHGWATVVAIINAMTQRRAASRHLRRGRHVICDRWALDSAVELRYRYGEARPFRMQKALLRLVSPRPAMTIYLDIRPEAARARKQDEFSVEQLRRYARLYAEECPRYGALRLDAERPQAELCADIAARVTHKLVELDEARRSRISHRLPARLRRRSQRP